MDYAIPVISIITGRVEQYMVFTSTPIKLMIDHTRTSDMHITCYFGPNAQVIRFDWRHWTV